MIYFRVSVKYNLLKYEIFLEKEIQDLSKINGGQDPITVSFTVHHSGFGDGIYWNARFNFDVPEGNTAH